MHVPRPQPVQIYDENVSNTFQAFSRWLYTTIEGAFGPIRIQNVRRDGISPKGPLLVVCHNHSRLGTDINHSVQGLENINPKQIAICVLHVRETHALPFTMPTDNLLGKEYERYGKMMDFAFTPEAGVYSCEMNRIGVEKLAEFLERHVSRRWWLLNIWPLRYMKTFVQEMQKHKKEVIIFIAVLIFCYCLYNWYWPRSSKAIE